MKEKRWKPYILNTLLTIALCGAYGLVQGVLTLPLGFLISALLGEVFYRRHYGLGILNSGLVLVIFALFYDLLFSLSASVPIVLLGLALALGTRFKLPLRLLMLLCSGLFMADLAVSMQLMKHLSGGAISIQSMMLESGEMMRELFATQYQGADAELVEKTIQTAVDAAIMLTPGMFMIVSTGLAFILIVTYKKMMQRHSVDMSFLISFENFQGDILITVLYLVLFLVLTAAPEGLFMTAALNVLLVLSFLYVVFGASVLDSVFKKRGMKKMIRRVLIITVLLFSSTFMMLPVFVCFVCGLSDSFFDYRKLRTKEEQ